MSQRIGVNVAASSHLIRLNPAAVNKVVHMLLGTLKIRLRIFYGHQSWKFRLSHRSPPSAGIDAINCLATVSGIHAETPR